MAFQVSRRGGIDPFIVLQVLRAAGERAAAGKAVFPLQIGQPSTPAPAGAREAAKAAIDERVLGYTDAPGIEPLRRRIALHYREHYGEEVAPERVFVTTGSSGGFVLAFLAAFDAGARVVLTDPSYPCYRNMLGALGIETVQVPTGPETRFQPTPELLERVEGPVDGLVVASPSNPTGSMLPPEALARLAAWCHDRGVRLVSDEIYHGIAYGMEEATAAGSPSAVTVNSFSKYFSMTGWRIGWLVLPEDLAVAVERPGPEPVPEYADSVPIRRARRLRLPRGIGSQCPALRPQPGDPALRPAGDGHSRFRDAGRGLLRLCRYRPPDE